MPKTRYGYEDGVKVKLYTGETQRKDGMFIFYYYDHEHKRRSISSASLEQLRIKKGELQEEMASGIRADKRTITLNAVHEEWLTTKTVNAHTQANYDWLYNSYVKAGFGKKAIGKITEGDVIRFYKGLIQEKHLAVSTVDGLQTVLQQVFIYAVRSHYIRENVCSGVMKNLKVAFGEKKEIKAFSLSEQQRFLSFMLEYDKKNDSHWYPMLATMLLTGLRVGELTGLQWNDVKLDGDHPHIYIRHNLVYYKDSDTDKMVWQMNKPKTQAGLRDFVLNKNAADALRMQREAKLECKVCIDGFDDFVFVNRFGHTQHQGTVNKALKRIITEANLDAIEQNKHGASIPILPSISSHGLRKSFITRCAEGEVSLKVCAKTVGHSDYRTTMDIYTMVGEEWEESEMKKYEKHINSKICITDANTDAKNR